MEKSWKQKCSFFEHMLLLDSKQDLRTYTLKQIVITARHSYQSILEYELEI